MSRESLISLDPNNPKGKFNYVVNPYVAQMHTRNGLWADLDDPKNHRMGLEAFLGTLFDIFEAGLVNIDDTVFLAGFSVHFDKKFLDAHSASNWPKFTALKQVSHRVVDVSSIKQFLRDLGFQLPVVGDTAHRAMADCGEVCRMLSELSWALNHSDLQEEIFKTDPDNPNPDSE